MCRSPFCLQPKLIFHTANLPKMLVLFISLPPGWQNRQKRRLMVLLGDRLLHSRFKSATSQKTKGLYMRHYSSAWKKLQYRYSYSFALKTVCTRNAFTLTTYSISCFFWKQNLKNLVFCFTMKLCELLHLNWIKNTRHIKFVCELWKFRTSSTGT